jgi:hypothetical protein
MYCSTALGLAVVGNASKRYVIVTLGSVTYYLKAEN